MSLTRPSSPPAHPPPSPLRRKGWKNFSLNWMVQDRNPPLKQLPYFDRLSNRGGGARILLTEHAGCFDRLSNRGVEELFFELTCWGWGSSLPAHPPPNPSNTWIGLVININSIVLTIPNHNLSTFNVLPSACWQQVTLYHNVQTRHALSLQNQRISNPYLIAINKNCQPKTFTTVNRKPPKTGKSNTS